MRRYVLLLAATVLGLLGWRWLTAELPALELKTQESRVVPREGAPDADTQTSIGPFVTGTIDPVIQEINAIDAETPCGARLGSVTAKAKAYLIQARLTFPLRDLEKQLMQHARFVLVDDKDVPYSISAPPYDRYTNVELLAMSEVGDNFAKALLGVRLLKADLPEDPAALTGFKADLRKGFVLLEQAMAAGERDVLLPYLEGKLLALHFENADAPQARGERNAEVVAIADFLLKHGSVAERAMFQTFTARRVVALRGSVDAPDAAETEAALQNAAVRFARLVEKDPKQDAAQEQALLRYTHIMRPWEK